MAEEYAVRDTEIDPKKCNKCKEEFEIYIHKPQTFPCGHRFCTPCYFSYSEKPQCPICNDYDLEKLQNWEKKGAKTAAYIYWFWNRTKEGAYNLYQYTSKGVIKSYRYLTKRRDTYDEVV